MAIRLCVKSFLMAFALASTVALAPGPAQADQGDCSQPATTGANPTASDCLFILRAAVGSATCTPECICDVNAAGGVTAVDALTCLKSAVGQDVTLNCPCGGCNDSQCPGPLDTCTTGRFLSVTGSDLDTGWNGLAHNQDLIIGAEILIEVVRRCVDDPETTCTVDSDCTSGECRPFCDCDDPDNSVCEIAGPVGQPRCVRDLAPCQTNGDCGGSICVRFFGPPLPLSAANTPACVTSYFQEDVVGTADAETGTGTASAFLRSRVHLGITNDKPCPRCGAPEQNPEIGDQFSCEGGDKNGASCTVDAVSPDFGGVSNDCPPPITSNISGEGLAIRFREVTTGSTARTAGISCIADGICVDDGSACSTNADCKRCTNNFAPCTGDGDCAGGTCAEAPEQPVSCGLWCHCGFCDNDPAKPCFSDDECDAGETCQAGNSGSGIQDQPNACADLICGRAEDERCCTDGDPNCPTPTPLEGSCSQKTYISCSGDPGDPRFGQCEREGAGTCLLEKRACFDHTIIRTGTPSPLGRYCVDDPDVGTCTSNADCNTGPCVEDTSEPTTVALFCTPKTASGAINAAGGIPGPGAVNFRSVIFSCRCGDGTVGCSEECDDGNNVNGDGCNQACRNE